ncbi:uncharacterized protein LOC143228270 isoform X2 [Tachypleus tridentatus]|uniref:uncharacterized protein LOC143228270 isoform X2 n=1 Tax=Tachypleus tridentatus TaxID=6853 RepID=UPI003FD66EA7
MLCSVYPQTTFPHFGAYMRHKEDILTKYKKQTDLFGDQFKPPQNRRRSQFEGPIQQIKVTRWNHLIVKFQFHLCK